MGLAAALLVCVVGPARADTNAQIVERVVRVIEQAATIVQATKNDCNLMGDKLQKLGDENAALFREAKERDKTMTDAERDAIHQRFAARVQAAVQRMNDGLLQCLSNPKVREAARRMQQ